MDLVEKVLYSSFKNVSDEQISAGYEGLIKAVEKFEPRRNIRFNTFAKKYILFAAIDELKAQKLIKGVYAMLCFMMA